MIGLLIILLYNILCGIIWRLRGGAFTTLTKIDPGTDGARAIAAVLIPLMLMCMTLNPLVPLVGITLMLGLMMTGWGAFQGMGLPPINMPERSWLRNIPLDLGFPENTFWHDFIGMAAAGVVCMLPSMIAALSFGHHAWVLLISGLGFAPAYALARLEHPAIPNFAQGQEWGEFYTGVVVGAGLLIVFT
jgi:hypothetical protein